MISYSALIDLSIVANNETNRRFILQLTIVDSSEQLSGNNKLSEHSE